jgi:hypothetical protein
MNLNRREFLKLAGVTLTSATLPISFETFADAPQRGRILKYVAVRGWADFSAPVMGHVLPDSIQPILDVQEGWVRIPGGYVPIETLQPMIPVNAESIRKLPAFVEVFAPSTSARAWCAFDAPLTSRIEHGTVLQATERLSDAHGAEWLQTHYGWIQAAHLQPINLPTDETDTSAELSGYTLTVSKRGDVLAHFTVNRPPSLRSGSYRIKERKLENALHWSLYAASGVSLGGATWHNQFGVETQGTGIELSVIAARALYGLLPPGSRLTVL